MKALTKAVENVKEMPFLAKSAALGGALAGINFGKGFPDIDIKMFGIGGHRHWTTHSVLTSLALYKAAKWYNEKLKAGKGSDFQKKTLKYVGAPLMAAFSVANAAHLFADMVGAKDVVGWPVNIILRGGMWKDRIWLGANGIGCLILAWKFIQITIGDEGEAIYAVNKEG